jgi:hypothetical protein
MRSLFRISAFSSRLAVEGAWAPQATIRRLRDPSWKGIISFVFFAFFAAKKSFLLSVFSAARINCFFKDDGRFLPNKSPA